MLGYETFAAEFPGEDGQPAVQKLVELLNISRRNWNSEVQRENGRKPLEWAMRVQILTWLTKLTRASNLSIAVPVRGL